MASTSSCNNSVFQGWNHFEDSLPSFYEQDILQLQPQTFRIKNYSFNDEYNDDSDPLYEAALLNSNLLAAFSPKQHEATSRLHQILQHINPNASLNYPSN